MRCSTCCRRRSSSRRSRSSAGRRSPRRARSGRCPGRRRWRRSRRPGRRGRRRRPPPRAGRRGRTRPRGSGRRRRASPAPWRRSARRRARPSGWPAAGASSSSGSTVPATRPRRSTMIWSATSSTSLSLWVMKMTVVPVAVSADDPEQLLGLGRRQDGGRLVEDEDVALAVERLEDLDALPHADREALDLRVRIDVRGLYCSDSSTIRLRAAARSNVPSGPATVSAPSATASTTSNTGTSMKCWWTMPTPASIAAAGSSNDGLLAVDEDLARVRLVEPGQDVHERRLAGAVLARAGRGPCPGRPRSRSCRSRGRPGTAW